MSSRWRLVYACAKGTSHEAAGLPCQDSAFGEVVEVEGGPALLVSIADGAGSAAQGGEGAEAACLALQDAASGWIEQAGLSNPPNQSILIGWVQAVHLALNEKAADAGGAIRDFACTLLAAVCTPNWAAFVQIGDGALVARRQDAFRVVFWPENGEYANQTHFVTDPGYLDHVMTATELEPVLDIAVMTDGLQRLALNYTERSAHTAFFEPLFSTLRKQPLDTLLELEGGLAALLNSQAVNSRTDDDKTLLIAALEHGC